MALYAEQDKELILLEQRTVRLAYAEEDAEEVAISYVDGELGYAIGLDEEGLSRAHPGKTINLSGWFFAAKNSTVQFSFEIDGQNMKPSSLTAPLEAAWSSRRENAPSPALWPGNCPA